MISHDRLHAMAYADNATRLHQLDKYRRKYPTLFVHAVVETRPIRGEYYVPPTLAADPIVERLAWNEEGCRLASCFPFLDHDRPCKPGVDSTQWVKVDNLLHVPACQPACERGLSLDARYDRRTGKCRVVNPAKKLFLMYPERYNGAVAKKVRLSYDRDSDRLFVGPLYCSAYGVGYDEEARDCHVSAGQTVMEAFTGSSCFRRLLSAPYIRAFERKYFEGRGGKPDASLLDRASLEEAWAPVPRFSERKRTEDEDHLPRRSPDEVVDELDEERHRKAGPVAIDLAIDVGADLGVQMSASFLKRRLTQSISNRLAKKILLDGGMKHAFFHGVSKTVASRSAAALAKSSAAAAGTRGAGIGLARGAGGLIALRSTLSMASAATAVYGVVNLAIDLFDPYEFGKMMYRDQVDAIDRALDLSYFETADFENAELSPEDVWNALRDEEEWEEDMEYYAERFREYLAALKTMPPLPPKDAFAPIGHREEWWDETRRIDDDDDLRWRPLHWSWIFGWTCLGFICSERVDVVAFLMLWFLLLWNYLR